MSRYATAHLLHASARICLSSKFSTMACTGCEILEVAQNPGGAHRALYGAPTQTLHAIVVYFTGTRHVEQWMAMHREELPIGASTTAALPRLGTRMRTALHLERCCVRARERSLCTDRAGRRLRRACMRAPLLCPGCGVDRLQQSFAEAKALLRTAMTKGGGAGALVVGRWPSGQGRQHKPYQRVPLGRPGGSHGTSLRWQRPVSRVPFFVASFRDVPPTTRAH